MDQLCIRPKQESDKDWIGKIMGGSWGGEPLVVRAQKFYPNLLEGLIAEVGDKLIGFLLYEIRSTECEIIVFEVFEPQKGTGSQMLEVLKALASKKGCKRLYLMTTNDNLEALRFYQRRGFHLCGLHINSVDQSRKIKPSIGYIGNHKIPIRDELDLECLL